MIRTTQAPHMDPSAYCPIFVNPTHIEGKHLVVRIGNKVTHIEAPMEFLQAALQWCQGTLNMEQLRHNAQQRFGDEEFMHFAKNLIQAGFLADGATALLHRWRIMTSYGNRFGHPLPKNEWPALRMRLPQTLEPDTQALPSKPLPRISALLQARSSCRTFSDAPVSAAQLGSWLVAAYGMRPNAPPTSAELPTPRTVPSGGALYPLELRLILRRPVDAWAPGIYGVRFGAQGQVGLQAVSTDLSTLETAYPPTPDLMNATGALVISGNLFHSARRYRNMALTLGLLEAGCVLQNLGLAASEAGLGWTAINGFDAEALGPLCGLAEDRLILTSGFFGVPQPV